MDVPSRLLIVETDRAIADDNVVFVNVDQGAFNIVNDVEMKVAENKSKGYSTPQESFVLCFPEIFTVANKAGKSKLSKPNLYERVAVQTVDIKYRLLAGMLSQPLTSLSFNCNRVRFKMLPVYSVPQSDVPSVLGSCIMRVCI